MMKDNILPNSNNGAQIETKTGTNIKMNLSKSSNGRRNTTLKCKSFCKVMFSPYKACHSEPSSKSPSGCNSFMNNFNNGLVNTTTAFDGNNKTKVQKIENDKIDAVYCQKIPACHSEPGSDSPSVCDSFINDLSNELANSLNAFEENNKTKKQKVEDKSNAVCCQKFPNSVPNINNIFSDPYKTTEVFLQNNFCVYLPRNINKCIECHNNQFINSENKYDINNIACRFSSFRQLQFNKSGNLMFGGFPKPSSDLIDMTIWLPDKHSLNFSSVDVKMSMKIVKDVGSLFCHFFAIEKNALNQVKSNKRKSQMIAWKKIVNGVREMCDVCKTSLFNYHWFCGKCGFVVCVDCFVVNKRSKTLKKSSSKKKWLYCSNQEKHQADKLHFAQIIAGNCLKKIVYDMHFICDAYDIHLDCSCSEVESDARLDVFHDSQNASNGINKDEYECFNNDRQRDVGIKCTPYDSDESKLNRKNVNRIPRYLKSVKNQWDAPHTWLCEGELLRLLDPNCEENYKIFQDIWSIGNPVLVSNVGSNLIPNLWHPQSFSRDFGNQKNDFINCVNGKVISNQLMSKFWDGFDNVNRRMCNSKGEPMLLKLKDWPPSTDFAEMLPNRFQNLMHCLPLKEYTHRDGKFNLASHLPECFVRPDLGPKMYTAYGFAGNKYEHIGTTNLHLDMTDAVNVMVYVAITKNFIDFDYNWHMRRVIELIEEAGCDNLMMKRIYEGGETPGALWHIYHPSEATSIRDLLTKVAIENKTPIEQFSDPIHDQQYYLDATLRSRLLLEYGVKGCTFVQFDGDAVFIPAGAPHQVRNLHNCIKVAEDFVSPENINHSYKMTQEFRCLSDDHTNHEDKLQVKNIVLHSIKDCVSILINNYQQIGEQKSCN